MNQSLPTFQLVGLWRPLLSKDRVIWVRILEPGPWSLEQDIPTFAAALIRFFPSGERDDVPDLAGRRLGQR
jgi:hypothetical protein